MGGVGARGHVGTCRCSPFLYLGNGWMDCAEIRFVARDLLARRFPAANGGIQVHVRTCTPLFRFSGTAGRIVLKLGVW